MSDQIIIWLLVFASVLLAVWGIHNMISATEKETASGTPALFRIFAPGIFFFAAEAGSLLEGLFPGLSKLLQEKINKAALSLEVKDMYGAFLCFGFTGALIGVILSLFCPVDFSIGIMLCLLFAVVCSLYPYLYISRLAEKREREILDNLPFAIDLISSSMNAGLDFGSAIRYLLAIGKDNILKKEFNIFLNDVELGKTRSEALKDMQQRINVKEFTRFVSAISYGMDSGSSIIEIMRIQSDEMRRVKFARAEQQAAKAPVKMIVPMVLFIFPSMFIIIAAAIFLRVKDSGVLQMIGR